MTGEEALGARLGELARGRLVLFAGLPGTGKSLLVQRLTHLASAAGRRVTLLQWDVARPVFEASPAGARYPLADGVTHPAVRKAAGLWVRHAVAEWNRRAGPEHLLVGETPFVGGRFIDLARRADDAAEAVLAAPSCRFALAVPSREVRAVVEAERERRAAAPVHPREREDAPPAVLRALWREVAAVAGRPDAPYDPGLYEAVYRGALRHRHVEVVHLDAVLPVRDRSVYEFAVETADLVPGEAEAERFIEEVERRYGDDRALERELARWWEV